MKGKVIWLQKSTNDIWFVHLQNGVVNINYRRLSIDTVYKDAFFLQFGSNCHILLTLRTCLKNM